MLWALLVELFTKTGVNRLLLRLLFELQVLDQELKEVDRMVDSRNLLISRSVRIVSIVIFLCHSLLEIQNSAFHKLPIFDDTAVKHELK